METIHDKRLKLLQTYYSKHRSMPSLSVMAKLFGVKSRNTAYSTVKVLIDCHFLRNENGVLEPTLSFVGTPVVGNVQAGWPSPAEEELRDKITVDEYLIRNKNSSCIVEARGDSMKDAGIMQGDMLIVEQGRSPKSGDIVIASVDNEFTVKRFVRDGRKAYLMPANKNYKPIKLDERAKIHSVVVGSFRRYT